MRETGMVMGEGGNRLQTHRQNSVAPRTRMFPIPAELNLDRLVGQQLQQICIGAYDVQFRFMGDDRIRCTRRVSVVLGGSEVELFNEGGWVDAAPLAKIVGRDVTAWCIESSHCFSVSLTENATIKFWSEDSPYEDIVIDPEVLVI